MNDWQFLTLKNSPIEIIDGDRGANYPNQADFFDAGFCLFLNTGNVTRNGFNFSNCSFVTEEKDRKLRKGKLQRYDIVLTTRGTVGNVAYYDDGVGFENIRINSGMVIMRPNREQIEPLYLYHYLQSPLFELQVKSFLTGSAQPQLPIGIMQLLEIPLPSLEEQRKIAAILSTWDEAIGLVEQLIAVLGRRKQALMQLLLTGEVRFAGFDGEWAEVELQTQLSAMTDYVANGSFEALRLNVTVTEVPDHALYVRLTDLRKGINHSNQKYVNQSSYEFLSKSALYGHEILIANIGENVGEVILMPIPNMPATIAPNMIIMRANSVTDPRFLYYYLSSPIGQRNISVTISGSGQPKLNKTELRRIQTLKIPFAEQRKVADIIETCDMEIAAQLSIIDHMQTQKRGLMQQLLTGQVRV
ncbi:MAG: restriction endonuclease subunit S [Anaerolineae bacterium]|nr:restriction endonuclease subunit S [Anaerolineae bacterium]